MEKVEFDAPTICYLPLYFYFAPSLYFYFYFYLYLYSLLYVLDQVLLGMSDGFLKMQVAKK